MKEHNKPPWPDVTGASLLMIPIRYQADQWNLVESAIREAIHSLDVDVERGTRRCPSYVRAGLEAAPGVKAEDVLIFSCPSGIGIFEAAPLVSPERTGMLIEYIAEFFRNASLTALKFAPKIAWVVAHDWFPGDRVRWEGGTVDDLVHFATSPGAWRTYFLGTTPEHIFGSDEWPFWFEVTR